ncbi:MAG: hypothetical protein ACRCUI_01580 [Polymorphobacter sp.]
MRCLALAALLLAAPAVAGPEGRYRLTGVQDAASGIELRADHRFSYGLSYGALDESAEGVWTQTGDTVLLTTQPTPKPPAITAGAATRTDEAPLRLRVVGPNGRGVALVDFEIAYASGEARTGYTQDYGWTSPGTESRAPLSVRFAVPMYGITSPVFPIDAARANDLQFVLTPNDLGVVDFRDQKLTVTPDTLLMQRGDSTLRYVRERK